MRVLYAAFNSVFIILAVAIYFRENGKADEKMREKRDAIEQELPRFVATVEQELKTSRDVLSIMENFKSTRECILLTSLT